MRRKFILILFILVLFNFVIIDVKAYDKCADGSEPVNGYCEGSNYEFVMHSSQPDYRGKDKNAPYFLTKTFCCGYKINEGTNEETTVCYNDEKKCEGICIDPSKITPEGAKTKTRKILQSGSGDKLSEYDVGLYASYQYLLTQLNECKGDVECENLNKMYFQAAIRAWTFYIGYNPSEGSSAYPDEWKHFYKCANEKIDSNIIKEGLDSNNNTDLCFRTGQNGFDKTKEVKNYYLKAYNAAIAYKKANEANKTNPINLINLTWKNNIIVTKKINTTKVENKDENIYNFTINFSGLKSFFKEKDSGSKLNLDNAELTATLYINGNDCSNGKCNAIATITNGNLNLTSSSNDTAKIIVEMSEEQYKANFANGNGKISVKYSYKHPMLKDNLEIVSPETTDKDGGTEGSNQQRILVMKTKTVEDEVIITVGKRNEKNICKHEYNKFTINNTSTRQTVDSLINFKNECGCENIDESLLNTNELKNQYERICKKANSENFEGEIKNCNGNATESYSLKYSSTKYPNRYCKKVCEETINVNNLSGKFSTIAGKSFNLANYPTLIATKSCDVSIELEDWKNEYKTQLRLTVDAYNDYKKYLSIQTAARDTNDYNYTYKYYKINIAGDGLSLTSQPIEQTASSNNGMIYIDLNSKRLLFYNMYSHLKNLIDDINVCNDSMSEKAYNVFYNFGAEISFIYEQEYENETIGLKNNTERPNNIDDSKLYSTINKGIDIQTGNNQKVSYSSLLYNDDNQTGTVKNNEVSNSQVNRTVGYTVTYRPSQYKYINTITGEITNVGNTKLKPLGNVYDIDITAKAKSNNNYYYEFKSLGDKDDQAIFKHLSNNTNSIKRSCTYEIKKELTVKNVLFKIVDPNNVDPNNRLGKEDGGLKNWTQADIDRIESEDTFNPDNMEYSFTLDIKTLKEIREYNNGNKYSDFTLACTNGDNCISKNIVCKYSSIKNEKCSR